MTVNVDIEDDIPDIIEINISPVYETISVDITENTELIDINIEEHHDIVLIEIAEPANGRDGLDGEPGPQGPPGELPDPESITLTRDEEGNIIEILFVTRPDITINRDEEGNILSYTNGVNLWVINREDGIITGIEVTEVE